jgi:hypothetical protein
MVISRLIGAFNVAKKEKKAKDPQKKGGKKNIVIIAICAVLVIAIAFSIYMLLKSRKASGADAGAGAVAGEKYDPLFSPGDVKIICDLEANPGAIPENQGTEGQDTENQGATGDASDPQASEGTETQDEQNDAETQESPPPPKDWSQDPAARYEILVNSASHLTAADKESYGLAKETGRLASLQLEVRLLDPAYDWGLYNRRIQDAEGNWLDEIKAVIDPELLESGESDQETLIIKLPAAETDSEAEESLTLYIYTSSWNNKTEADGQCQISIPPPPTPGSKPVIQNVDTEFGNWTGGSYRSAQLDMSISLPEGWSFRSEALQETNDDKAIEGLAVRSDNQATFQLSVNKDVGSANANDQVTFFKNLLEKAVGQYTVSGPFFQTIAGKEYTGLTYFRDNVAHQLYFYKKDNNIIEVALRFPNAEDTGPKQLLANLKPLP